MAVSWRDSIGSDRLLVSGFGRWGGGIYDLTEHSARAVDDLPTSGIAVGGDQVWRLLRAPGERTGPCELLSYDERGVRRYQRLDDVRDPHDVCWHDGAPHVSSSWDGSVRRIEADGTTRVIWSGGTVPDSWHVNSLVVAEDRLHVCAFGRYDQYKAWKVGDDSRTSGFVHDTVRGVDVLSGLNHPHSPRRANGRWYVCESGEEALTEYDLGSGRLRRCHIGRHSRGLTVIGKWALVGGSARRDEENDYAALFIVDLDDLKVVDEVTMPCMEVYDVIRIPFRLARGIALGFGSNAGRAADQHRTTSRPDDQRSTTPDARVQMVSRGAATAVAAAGEAIDADMWNRFSVTVNLPPRMRPGQTLVTAARVKNSSSLLLASVDPRPIQVGARWLRITAAGADAGGRDDSDKRIARSDVCFSNPLTPIPNVVFPDDSDTVAVVLSAPADAGTYVVQVSLHQLELGWFGTATEAEIAVRSLSQQTTDELVR